VERAVANDVIIIPFRIEKIDPTGAMAYFLAAEHWLDAIKKPFEKPIQELIKTIKLYQDDIYETYHDERINLNPPVSSQKPTGLGLFNILRPKKEQKNHRKRVDSYPFFDTNLSRKEMDKATPYLPFPQVDNVNFSVTSPPITYPGSNYVFDVWAFLEEDRQKMIERAHEEASGNEIRVKSKGTFKLERGSVLTVQLEIANLSIEPEYDTIQWVGEIGNASFMVTIPQTVVEGTKKGLARISLDGFRVTEVHFTLRVGEYSSKKETPTQHKHQINSAFVSYASQDQEDCLLVSREFIRRYQHWIYSLLERILFQVKIGRQG
jgi:hypothetical protein